MIAISRENGGLIRVISPDATHESPSSVFGFHPVFGFMRESALGEREQARKMRGLRTNSNWICRFAILSEPDGKWSLQGIHGCETERLQGGGYRISTALGPYLLSNSSTIDAARLAQSKADDDPTLKRALILSALILFMLPFLPTKKIEIVPEVLPEPIAVKILPEKQKAVALTVPAQFKTLQKMQQNNRELKRAVDQNLGFLGMLGKKDLTKALGGLPTQLKDASAGAGPGGKEGSGGELLVGLGQGVKRTTVGNTGTSGLGGVGTKGAGGGAGGYGNSLVGSGEGKALSAMAVSQDMVLEGGLDRSVIQATIAKYISQVRACYENGLRGNPGLAGQVTMAFEIAPEGGLNFARVARTSLGHAEVEKCISARMMGWVFPKPLGGVSVKVSYPFLLRPVSS